MMSLHLRRRHDSTQSPAVADSWVESRRRRRCKLAIMSVAHVALNA